jgi:uncharacterized membrane protein
MSPEIRRTLGLSPFRIEALTDGVFAIVMTLLVLELGVPVITGGGVHAELLHRLGEMWPEFVSYAVSFLMLGFMWTVHHYQFKSIKQSDGVLAWVNLLFLMFVSLLPFTTSLLGKYINEQLPVLLYGGNIVACMVLRLILWNYATKGYRLVDKDIPPAVIKRSKIMLPTGIVVFIIGMGVSFVSTVISVCLFAAIIVFFSIRSTYYNRIRLES